jgi:hypothetical protein
MPLSLFRDRAAPSASRNRWNRGNSLLEIAKEPGTAFQEAMHRIRRCGVARAENGRTLAVWTRQRRPMAYVVISTMQVCAPCLFLALISCGSAQTGPTGSSTQKALIDQMREAAVNYADRLQDFLCTQFTTRSEDSSGFGKHWKVLETQELELGYIAHKEHYRLVKVNGKTTDPDRRIKKGYFRPGGEFGTSLQRIFNPKAAAEFEWDHEESSAGKRSCVFRYHVPLETSTLVMTADLDQVKMAHHGLVTADCDTGAVTRIQIETAPASVIRHGEHVAIGLQLDVAYGLTAIGSKEFLLPQQAIEIVPFGKSRTKAEIRFENYRKYDSDSNITFDDGPIKPPDIIK